MKHDFFIIHTDKHPLVNVLTKEQKSDVFDALFSYAETGEKPQLEDSVSQAVFISLCIEVERHWLKSDKRSEANRENGRKGGAPKGNSNARKQEEDNDELSDKTTQNNQNNQSVESVELSDKTTQNNKNKNKSKNKNQNKNSIKSKSERIFDKNSLLEEGKRIDELYDMGQWSKYCDFVMSFWNDVMEGKQCHCITKMPTKRKQLIRSLLDKGHTGLEILKAIMNTAESPYLNGAGEDGFVASFDWVLSPTHFGKVVDNDYREWK